MIKRLLFILIGIISQLTFSQDDILPNQLPPIELAKIPTTETTSYFGNSISFSANGNTLAIGEHGYGTPTRISSGRVRIYTNETGAWLQKGQDLIGIEDSFNTFGEKVELSSDGNTVAIYDAQINLNLNTGETLDDKFGSLAPEYFPYIQVYKFNNGNWTKIGTDFLFADNLAPIDMSLAGNGTTIAISSKTGTKIYELSSNNWTQTGQEIPTNNILYQETISLSEDGKTIIVGTPFYSDPNTVDEFSYEGQVKVYENIANTWTQLGNTINSTTYLAYFGSKVSMASNGTVIAITSEITNDKDHVSVYELAESTWIQKGNNISQSADGKIISMQLSGDGNNIIIGEAFNARILKYTTDWEQVNLNVEGDHILDELGVAVSISDDGKKYAVGASAINNSGRNGYVTIYANNKNNVTRFGNEIYGYGTYDDLGSSVVVSDNGNIFAVGASISFNDNGTLRYGHVRVFEKTSNGFQQIGADIRNTTDFDSGSFGKKLALNATGNFLAIAAPTLETSSNGAVYVYQRSGNNWNPIGNVIKGLTGSATGTSISFSDDGSILAIGSGTNPTGISIDNYAGYTTMYKYNTTNNTWDILGAQISGEASRDYSGNSIDLSGDGTIVAIGATGNDGATVNGGHGHVRVFNYNNTNWEQMGDDIDGNPDFNINFGGIVTLSNDGKTLIISDINSESSTGSIEIYNWNESTNQWNHETQLKSSVGNGALFGHATSISDDKKILVVGEPRNGKGKVYVYVKDETGTWTHSLSLDGTKNSSQSFGESLNLSSNGNTLVVASPKYNGNGTQTGMAALYHLNLCSSIEAFEVFNGVEDTIPQISNNLIENGSAEILPLSDNGWTTVSGDWKWPIREVSPVPIQDGHKYFKSVISGTSEIYQDIDVSRFENTIDAGNQYFYFGAYLQSFKRSTIIDDGQAIVEYRNASGTVLTSYDSGLSNTTENWTLFEDTRIAPIGTKTIRVRLLSINNAQFFIPTAYIDNVILTTAVSPNAISIPDVNFEQYLIDENIDSDGTINGQVLKVDIENISKLTINDKNISDLTGIEYFTSLIEINATNNEISSIDLSKNLLLEKLFIANNQLTSINLSENNKLKNIDIGDNSISTIEVYHLTDLESLSCYKNQLTDINLISNLKLLSFIANENQLQQVDLRENKDLFWVDVDDNALISLNLKNDNNNKISIFSATGNSNLTCIEVDDATWSENNWMNIDNMTSFSTNCSPGNDDCSNAISLILGQDTPGDVINANANNNPYCAVGDVIADVWYSVTVPESGEFKIEGTGFGGNLKFAVYQSCESLIPITCGDAISLSNLTVGTVFYLKVWLESSDAAAKNTNETITGSFIITAEDQATLSIDEVTPNNKIKIFPNPANENITITLDNALIINEVLIYNTTGKKVIHKAAVEKTTFNVDISSLSKGVYFVKTVTNNNILTKKLLIK